MMMSRLLELYVLNIEYPSKNVNDERKKFLCFIDDMLSASFITQPL